jgi:hypothetical protein
MKYNERQYNAQRYNINGVFYAQALAETANLNDGTQLASVLKLLTDSIMASDVRIMALTHLMSDTAFFDDMIQIQFTNKALNDTLRLADWLSIERNPANNEWAD